MVITGAHNSSYGLLVIKKPNTRTLGLSWPHYTIRQIQTPISMHVDHNYCAAKCFSENYRLKNFCYLKLATHFMHSKKLTNKNQKTFSEKQKGFRDGLSCSTPQETRGNAITQPQSHLIPKL